MRLLSSFPFAVAAASISRNKEIGYLAGNSNHRAHSPNPALTVNGGSTSFAALELFRLGRGGNCRSLREHCSPVVNQALKPMRYRIQCGIIHRVLVSASGFGPFPF